MTQKTTKIKNTTKRKPTSPGEILSVEFLLPLGISQTELAKHIKCDVKVINRLINEHTALTAKMAIKLAATLIPQLSSG